MTTSATNVPRRSATPDATHRTAATISVVAAGGFLAVVAALHVLKSELSPTWRMVSEYEIGRHGWLMSSAFLLLAVACVSTARALAPVTANTAGRVGRSALCLTAGGLVLAAFATTDPVTATSDQLTTHGNVHGVGTAIGIPAFVVAAIAMSRSLRDKPGMASLHVATAAVVIAVVVFVVSMVVMFDGPPTTPDVRIGLQNRLLVAAYAAWLITAGWAARRSQR